MSTPEPNPVDLRRIRRVLRETARLAREGSLTGSLQGGMRNAVRQYNQILRFLEERGAVPAGFFLAIPEDANFDEVGIAAAQLAGYLADDGPESGWEPGHGRHRGGPNNISINVSGIKELEELKDLGRVVRENLPEWLRGEHGPPGHHGPREGERLRDLEPRLVDIRVQMRNIGQQLSRPDLDDEARAALAAQLARLAAEQARLRQETARRRADGPPEPPQHNPPPSDPFPPGS